MKGFKSLLFLCAITIFSIDVEAQSVSYKGERHIYLWDVTLSTKGEGVGNPPNIYNDVVKFLSTQINNIVDPNTEIYVLPFQTDILEHWYAKANEKGKSELISRIRLYNNNIRTNTNISGPMKKAVEKYNDSSKRTLIYVLTDGKQNVNGGVEALRNYIGNSGWQNCNNSAYLLYFMLTDKAVDNNLVKIINDTNNAEVIMPDALYRQWLDIQIQRDIRFNIKDDKEISVTCNAIQKIKIPEGLIFNVSNQNSQIPFSEKIVLKDNKLTFEIKYDYKKMKDELGEETVIPINVELLNSEEIAKRSGTSVQLIDKSFNLHLINKPEKTLKIKLR